MSGADVLRLDSVTVAQRLAGISAALRGGEVTAICGPNGAGKSSLLACLAGLLHPEGGGVSLDGAPLSALPPRERARALGYLPQSPEVAWDLAVEALVSLGRIPWRGAPMGEEREAIDEALATMDLSALRHRPVSRLSGGERARVLMARVLATRPRWLLADEPLANLDLAHAAALLSRLRQQATLGRGVVLVLHDLAAAMNHADRVLVLDRGTLVTEGPPEQVLTGETIGKVWGVSARWLGEKGRWALATG